MRRSNETQTKASLFIKGERLAFVYTKLKKSHYCPNV